MIVTEVYRALCQMKQIGTCGLGGIDGVFIRLSAPATTDTYLYLQLVY